MKDESRIIFNALLAQVTRVTSMGVAFLMVPYLIGRLGEETYGVIGIAGSILGLLALIEFGIRPATVRQYTSFLFNDEPRRANELVSTSLVFYLGLALVILLALGGSGQVFLGAMQVSGSLMPVAYWTLLAAGLALAVNLITTPYRAALLAHLRYDVQHYTDLLTTLLRAALIVLVFELWSESLLVWALASVVAGIVVFFVTRIQSFRVSPTLEVRPRLASRRGWRDLSSLSLDATLSQFSSWLSVQSGPVIVAYFLGAAAVTHYAPVLVVVNTLISFSFSFIQQLVPVMTRAVGSQNFGLMQRALIRSTRYSMLTSGAAAAWVASHAGLLIPAWLGPGFEDTALTLVVWAMAVVLRAYTGASFPVFLGANRLRGIAIFNLFLAVTTLPLAVYLVGYTDLGVVGAAIAALVGQAARTVVRVVIATRVCRIGVLRFARRSYLGPSVCLATVSGVAWGVQEGLALDTWLELLVSGGTSLMAFTIVAWMVGLTGDDRAKMIGYARRSFAKFV